MSIDTAIADLMKSVAGLTAALEVNTANLERVIAGQAAAMEKLEGTKATGTRTPRAKKEDATPKTEDAPKVEEKPKNPDKPKAAALPKNADELKTFVSAWTGGTDDADERAARVQFLKDIAAELGVAPKFAELAGAEDGIKKTVFYINRKKEGLKVDFGADYDLDGDPAQDAAGNEDGGVTDSDDDF